MQVEEKNKRVRRQTPSTTISKFIDPYITEVDIGTQKDNFAFGMAAKLMHGNVRLSTRDVIIGLLALPTQESKSESCRDHRCKDGGLPWLSRRSFVKDETAQRQFRMYKRGHCVVLSGGNGHVHLYESNGVFKKCLGLPYLSEAIGQFAGVPFKSGVLIRAEDVDVAYRCATLPSDQFSYVASKQMWDVIF